jgi:hypothetical protein
LIVFLRRKILRLLPDDLALAPLLHETVSRLPRIVRFVAPDVGFPGLTPAIIVIMRVIPVFTTNEPLEAIRSRI